MKAADGQAFLEEGNLRPWDCAKIFFPPECLRGCQDRPLLASLTTKPVLFLSNFEEFSMLRTGS